MDFINHVPIERERLAYRVAHEANPNELIYIPINRLRMPYQTDKATDWDKVRELVERMELGEALPPIVVGYDHDVHDGHHRVIASEQLRYTHVPCEVRGTNEIERQRALERYRELWKAVVWDESKHPRDERGRFRKKGEASMVAKPSEEPSTSNITADKTTKTTSGKKTTASKKRSMKAEASTNASTEKEKQDKDKEKKRTKGKTSKKNWPTILAQEWHPGATIRIKAERIGSYKVNGTKINTPEDLATMFADLSDSDREKLYVVAVKDNVPIGTQCVHIGAVDVSIADQKDIIKLPLLSKADGFYLIHNHPTGKSIPSEADFGTTHALFNTGDSLKIPFLGHVVIGDGEFHYMDTFGRATAGKIDQKRAEQKDNEIPLYETYQEVRTRERTKITSPQEFEDYIKTKLGLHSDYESVYMLALNTKLEVVGAFAIDVDKDWHELRKEILQHAVLTNAKQIAFATGNPDKFETLCEIGIRGHAKSALKLDVMDVMYRDPLRHTRYVSMRSIGNFDKMKSLVVELRKALDKLKHSKTVDFIGNARKASTTKALLIDVDDLEFLNKPILRKSKDKELTGGRWVTIRGRHVYIKNGKIVAGNVPWDSKTMEISNKNGYDKTNSNKNTQKEGGVNNGKTKQNAGAQPKQSKRGRVEKVSSTSREGISRRPKENGQESGRNRGNRKSISINGTEVEVINTFAPLHDGEHTYYEIKHAGVFHNAIKEAKVGNPYGAFVHAYEEEEYKDMRLFLSPNGESGFALKPDGDIVSVFSNPKTNTKKGVASTMLRIAIQNGGKKLDCFDGFLPKLYEKFGFVPKAKLKFNREYAPEGWNYERDGEPDVVFFRHSGEDLRTVLEKLENGTYTRHNLDDVPYAEDYDEALALQNDIRKSIFMYLTARTAEHARTLIENGLRYDVEKGIWSGTVVQLSKAHKCLRYTAMRYGIPLIEKNFRR